VTRPSPKRILFISRCPPWPLYLGDRLILYHLGRELSLRHHELDLLAFANRPEDWHEQHHYDMAFHHVELFPEPPRSQFSYLQRMLVPGARWPRTADRSWSPAMWRAIKSRLESEKYDVVHLFGGIQVYEFRHTLGDIPAIITPYESYSLYLRRTLENPTPVSSPQNRDLLQSASTPPPHTMERGLGDEIMARLQWHIARRFESFMFAPYRKTVVVSDRDQAELLGINLGLQIEVIPNGVDTYEFRPRPTRRIPALLFVGNYEYPPNVDAALRLAREIFPRVQAKIPYAHLWLVGNAPTPEMTALATDSIRVTGRVPDVRPYLARAAAFVSPLRLGAGIKNKVLEALAMGCPVVATPLSVDGIDMTHNVDALVADGDALVETIIRVLGDGDLQQRLSVNGRKLIESRYSWDHVAERYLALYEQVSRQ
jgi:glycosyltransferase involved in cell wall biosynthesis